MIEDENPAPIAVEDEEIIPSKCHYQLLHVQ